MEFETIEAIPVIPEIEQLHDRQTGGRMLPEARERERRHNAAPLPDWQGRVLDIFA